MTIVSVLLKALRQLMVTSSKIVQRKLNKNQLLKKAVKMNVLDFSIISRMLTMIKGKKKKPLAVIEELIFSSKGLILTKKMLILLVRRLRKLSDILRLAKEEVAGEEGKAEVEANVVVEEMVRTGGVEKMGEIGEAVAEGKMVDIGEAVAEEKMVEIGEAEGTTKEEVTRTTTVVGTTNIHHKVIVEVVKTQVHFQIQLEIQPLISETSLKKDKK